MQGDLDIVDPLVEEYLLRIAGSPDPVEADMRRYADERDGFPIAGPLVGYLLQQLTLLVGARRVFEVGSGFGYSAFWFARALPAGGTVTLTETSGELLERAHTWLEQAGLLDRCAILPPGDGIAALGASDEPLDLVFLDGRKEDYPRALSVALPRLRSGGLVVANSVLWGGAVARGETDVATAGLREYTRVVFGSEDLVSTLIPLRDGVALTYKR
jgi:caffeoyl-CoA O-methyltransferase